MAETRLFHRSETVALNYRDEGSGAPVLFVHGVGASLDSWDGVISHLSDPHRFIRHDLRGHGHSAHTPGPYLLDDFVADSIALLDHLEIEKVALAGFSLGG